MDHQQDEGRTAPHASIVLCAYGRRELTERCLQNLEYALGDQLGTRFELVLVDNGSPDDTAALFDSWRERATVVTLARNGNYAGGNNAGARAARGDALVFLSNDVEVLPGAVETLSAQALEPGVGAAGARLIYPDGTLQHGGVIWRSLPWGATLPCHLFHHEPGDLGLARATYDLDAVTAALFAMPRALFLELGGFDEHYVNGLEDMDLCVRTRLAGRRIVYRGDACAFHIEMATRTIDEHVEPNIERFVGRWGHLFEDDEPTVERLFGARFSPDLYPSARPEVAPGGSPITIEGPVVSLAPEAAEARALLAWLDECGLEPALRDWQPSWYAPRLDDDEWERLRAARLRPSCRAPLALVVASGSLFGLLVRPGSVVRLAGPRPLGSLEAAAEIWASSPAVAERLERDGVPTDKLVVIPPLIADVPLGVGGSGVIALLPSHDPERCRVLLAALAALTDSAIRVVPSVHTDALAQLIAERLPTAELLAPVTNESAWAALAAGSDVAVCIDETDAFDRRALLAARAGAATVSLAEGTAAAVLGPELAMPWRPGDDLSEAIVAALTRTSARRVRAERVREQCGPAAAGATMRARLEALSDTPIIVGAGAPARP